MNTRHPTVDALRMMAPRDRPRQAQTMREAADELEQATMRITMMGDQIAERDRRIAVLESTCRCAK